MLLGIIGWMYCIYVRCKKSAQRALKTTHAWSHAHFDKKNNRKAQPMTHTINTIKELTKLTIDSVIMSLDKTPYTLYIAKLTPEGWLTTNLNPQSSAEIAWMLPAVLLHDANPIPQPGSTVTYVNSSSGVDSDSTSPAVVLCARADKTVDLLVHGLHHDHREYNVPYDVNSSAWTWH